MSNVITKRYVKALMDSYNEKNIVEVQALLLTLSNAFSMPKLLNILSSTDISKEDKCDFVLSLIQNVDSKMKNFLSLLAQNDRLSLIPSIYEKLRLELSIKDNVYEGKVISDSKISQEQLEDLEKSFSKKFNSTIKLTSTLSNFPGVKVQLDALGVEASFSMERLKTQMTEYILKSI